jgi:hypothetical protein
MQERRLFQQPISLRKVLSRSDSWKPAQHLPVTEEFFAMMLSREHIALES